MLVYLAVLFALLQPGFLLQIPSKKIWMTGKTSLTSILVHAVLFAVLVHLGSQYMNSYSAFQGIMDGASSNPPGGSGTPPAPGTCQADVKGFIQPIISAAMQRGIKDVSPLLQSETATISEVITAMQTYKRTIDKDLATLNNPKKWPSSCATNSEFKNEMKIFSAAYKVMFNFYNNTIKFLNKYRCITVKAANILLQNRATQDFIDFEALMAKFGTDITPIYNSWEPMMRKYNLTMN